MLKFICALLVIWIHTRPFQASNVALDKLFYYDISNYAVPFFYACTGYFLIARQPEKELHTKLLLRCKKVMKLYLIWSVIYLPLTICGWWIEDGGIKYWVSCLRNYIFVGENFYSWTLWYLNGLIFALLLINILLKWFSIKQIFGIGTFAYLVGIGLNMLYRLFGEYASVFARLGNLYFSLFVTTRNGLFQSLVFVMLGMLIAEIDQANELKLSVKNGFFTGIIYVIKVGFSLMGGVLLKGTGFANVLVLV